jgi:hypothetical protein
VRGVSPTHLFAIGGLGAGNTPLATVEAFAATTSQVQPTDPTAAITTLTPLPAPRIAFAIAAAAGRIYIAGGLDQNAELATTLEYNPAANPPGGVAGPPGTPSGVWTDRAPLPAPVQRAQMSSPPTVVNFLPSPSSFRDPRQDAIAEWIQRKVRSAVAPLRGSSDPDVASGRSLFATVALTGVAGFSCASCHGGPKWTRSTVDYTAPPSPDRLRGREVVAGAELITTASQPVVLVDVGTFVPFTGGRNNECQVSAADVSVRGNALGANGFNIPSLLSVAATAPYFHNGAATTLDQVLDGSVDGNGTGLLRSVHHVTDAAQRAQLIAFLRSLDETTPTFP